MDLLPFDEYVRSLHRKRMSAGVLFRDGAGRVLLVEPSYKPQWDIPGGAVDADESPWVTAVREVREELGIERPLARLLVIDHVPADDRMPEGMAFVFDGGRVTEEEVRQLALTDPEIVSVGLYALDEAKGKVKPSLAARLAVAVDAAARGELVLSENGERIAR
ncbi:NUDIX hydrolase [Saccharomonospora sp. NPDC046836]|uniref:NUDIX hydrolase n=1 Tax=Saccharomonospora sp. NPDC046836 TaxID=3156921 RepID=UPI0033FAE55E